MNSNRVVCDLSKVQYAKLFHRNQYGDERDKQLKHSCHGCTYNPTEICMGTSITMEDYAVMCGIKDHWIPVLKLQFAANHSLEYTGNKALAIYAEYCNRIFNKTKTKKH